MRSWKVIRSLLSVIFFVFILQIASIAARSFFQEQGTCNANASWGINLPSSFILLLSCGVLVAFVFLWEREKNSIQSFFWLLLFSAGLSNMIERIYFGCIFDYIHFSIIPIFNLADVLLTVGVVLSLVYSFYQVKKSPVS